MGYLHEKHGMTLLGRTPEGTCPECAVKHDPEQRQHREYDRPAEQARRVERGDAGVQQSPFRHIPRKAH